MKVKLFRRFPAIAALALFASSTGLVQAAGMRTLQGHVPQAISRMNLNPVSDLAPTTRLHLAIGLPLRNQEALTNLIREIYDPASSQYHHYLTPEEFAKAFGPTEQDYQTVKAFANANGLTVDNAYSNRVLVDVSGSVGDIERAFHVKMRLYHHPTENRDFYAPDTDPSVASSLPILDIVGMNNYELPHPLFRLQPGAGKLTASGSGPGGTYMGYDFRHAYAPNVSFTGTGQTVALFEMDGYYPNDIAYYETVSGLPNVTVVPVLLGGTTGIPSDPNAVVEVSLDIEMAIAMAPQLSRVMVYEAPLTSVGAYDILNQMATDNQAKQISSSWVIDRIVNSPVPNQIYLQYAAQGQSFFQASGDEDAYTPTTFQTADSPYITTVGGTTLSTTGTGGAWASETVWNWGAEYGPAYDGIGSGGGISVNFPIPSYQQGINMGANQGSTTMRNVPDVALTADNIYVRANGQDYPGVGGTSCAAPLWAGFTALINQAALASGQSNVGFINPLLYAIAKGPNYAADFHDTVTGNNEWSGSLTRYVAAPGYDLCTGLGTPNGINLINDLTAKRIGLLQVDVTPHTGSALLQNRTQPISVTVNDIYGVTNATVTALVTNSAGTVVANLVFANLGLGSYSQTLSVPNAANPLTMILAATAPGEIGATNIISYSIVGPPANDNFTNATKVASQGGSYTENNRLATIEPAEPYHDGDTSRAGSVWWSWMPTSNTNVFIDTIGSTVDNVLAVYTGGSLVDLQPVAGTNSSLASYKPAQMSFSAQGGTTYYIAVAGQNLNSLGSISLHVTPGGQPDTNAPVVTVTAPQSGLTVLNNVTFIAGTAADSGINPSGIERVFINLNGIPLVAIGTTNWFSPLPLQPNLNIIKVSAVDQAGNFSATRTIEVNYLAPFVANDFFANAAPLTGFVVATNTTATREVGEPDPTGNPGGKSLWWSFTPSSDSLLELTTLGSTFDTIMGVYTGTNVANLTPVAQNDDAYTGAPGGYSRIDQAVKAGQTYYILIDGYNGASGTINLGDIVQPYTIYNVSVTNSGGGTVQLTTTNGDNGIVILSDTSENIAGGWSVTLAANPDHGYQFGSWNVNSTVYSANPLTVQVNNNLTIAANFVPETYTDGFESGNLTHIPWTTAGDAPWFVQTNVVDVGQYAARSGLIGDSQSSSLILSNVFTNGIGSFDFKVSSEGNWDFLKFYVDGALLAQWSGEVGWATFSFPLSAGAHTLEWTYAKDQTINLGLDAAFLDDVNLPMGTGSVSSVRPQLQLQRQSGGGLVMNLVGQTNQEYVIQASTDLVHWQNVSTNVASNGVISVPIAPNATNRAQFYRAVTP